MPSEVGVREVNATQSKDPCAAYPSDTASGSSPNAPGVTIQSYPNARPFPVR